MILLAADTGIIGISPVNLVLLNTFLNYVIDLSTCSLVDRSILLSMMISLLASISPMTMHSAVYVYIPLLTSTTKNIKSMIYAPPIIVLISEACPGQSTNVNWKNLYTTISILLLIRFTLWDTSIECTES